MITAHLSHLVSQQLTAHHNVPEPFSCEFKNSSESSHLWLLVSGALIKVGWWAHKGPEMRHGDNSPDGGCEEIRGLIGNFMETFIELIERAIGNDFSLKR